jgi:hypothetical protein
MRIRDSRLLSSELHGVLMIVFLICRATPPPDLA